MSADAIWHLLLLLLLGTVVVQAVVLVAVMRQVGTILLQIRPPHPGMLEGGPAIGRVLDLPDDDDATPSAPAVVLFVTPNCAPCRELVPVVPIVARHYPAIEFIAVVTGTNPDERLSYAETLEGVVARPDFYFLQDKWKIPGTPYAVGLDDERRVVEAGVVNHLDHLEALCESLLSADVRSPRGAPHELSSNGGRSSDEIELASSSS